MTDMTELKNRKQPLNLAIVHVDPDAFVANFMGWLEITAFITAQRAGEAGSAADGITPALSAAQLKGGGVRGVGDDAVFAFCMTAALKADKAAVDTVEAALVDSMGKEFPGSFALWHFRTTIDAPQTLDDFVGQTGKKMLACDLAAAAAAGQGKLERRPAFLREGPQIQFRPRDHVPAGKMDPRARQRDPGQGRGLPRPYRRQRADLRESLEDTRNDQPFIANFLLKLAPAVDMELTDEYQGFLRSLARRA